MEEQQQGTTRRSATAILEVVKETAVEELDRPTSIFGLLWFAGSAAMGALYDRSIADLVWFSVAAQALALILLLRFSQEWAGHMRHG